MQERNSYNGKMAKLGNFLLEKKTSSETKVFNDYFFSLIEKKLKERYNIFDFRTENRHVLKKENL